MSDWEVKAPDDATMQLMLSRCNIRNGDGLTPTRVRFCVNYYGNKYLAGSTVLNASGLPIPQMLLQAGVYAMVRWIAPNVAQNAFPPSGVTLPAGVSVTALSGRRFF